VRRRDRQFAKRGHAFDLGIVFVPGIEVGDDARVGSCGREQVFVIAAPEPQSECDRHMIPGGEGAAYLQRIAQDDDHSDVRKERLPERKREGRTWILPTPMLVPIEPADERAGARA
jgi:hypothetical protein